VSGPDRWTRALSLFEQTLDLPPGEVAAFLDAACAGDPRLRADLDSLLEADRKAPAFLDRTPFGLGEREPAAVLTGVRLGAYRVVREIGRGGMSTVYLGERADGEFEQRVAIKVLQQNLAGARMAERFAGERRILATLQHSAIVSIIDSGTTPDGRPYLVMEYVAGERIDRWCDARRLTIAERLRLFRHVLDAVAYAHRALVVHRDLKPDNILVTGDGQVRLLDFGIAKLLGEHGDDVALTRTGVRPMTPEYAAPEQVRGERVTTACDIYALGVLLFELLTGRRPYDADTSTRASMERAILESEPERPSRAVGRTDGSAAARGPSTTPESIAAARRTEPLRLRGVLNGDLDAIVLTALRKEPEARYRSADALSEDIDRYLGSMPVGARRGSRSYRIRKFVRRHRSAVTVAAGIVALLLGSTAAISASRVSAEQARLRAEQEARTAREVTEFLVGVFGGSDPFEITGDTVTARTLLNRGRERIDTELSDEPIVRAELLHSIGRVYSNLGRYEIADTLLQEAVDIRNASGEEPDTALTRLYAAQGDNASAWRDFPAAVHHYSRALDSHVAAGTGGDTTRARMLSGIADAFAFSGAPDSALSRIQEALDIDRIRSDSTSENHLRRRLTFAVVVRHAGDLEGAAGIYEDLLPRLRDTFGADHFTYATALNNAAFLETRLGRWREAVPLYTQALAVTRAIVGPEHPRSAMLLSNLASALHHSGSDEEALAALRERLELANSAWPDGHWRVGSAHKGLGLLLFRMGRYAEADTTLRAGIASYRETIGAGHPWTLVAETWVVLTMLKRDDPGASDLLDRAIQLLSDAELDADMRDDIERIVGVLTEHGDLRRAERFRLLIAPGAG
jgi:serine/threonine-protein kinase